MRLLLISNSRDPQRGLFGHSLPEMEVFLNGVCEVLFVPYALGDPNSYTEVIRQCFSEIDCEVRSIHTETLPLRALERSSAVLVGGGNTFRLLNVLYELDLMVPLQRSVRGGLPYIGSSAGVNLACPTIKTTNDMPIVYPPSFNALNLVPFNINPHFVDVPSDPSFMGESREERIMEFHELNDPPVVGLREGCWLRIEDKQISLMGASQGARVFFKGQEPKDYSSGASLDFLMEAKKIFLEESEVPGEL